MPAAIPMHILVTGARGFIGSHILAALARAAARHDLHALSRSPGPLRAGAPVTVHRGDVTRPDSLPAACAGIACVIHCVQFPHHPVEDPRKGWTYLRVDGEGTCHLVDAARAAGVRRFIYLSGAGVGPERTEHWFRAKWMAEEAIRASGMEYVLLRPSMVYGPGDRSLNRLIALVQRLPIIPVIGNGQQRLHPVHVDDLAALVARAVEEPRATNQVFEVGGAEYTMDGLLQTIASLMGKRRYLLHAPKALAKGAAAVLQHLPSRPLTPGAVDFLTMDVGIDATRAREVFGWSPRPLKEYLRRYGILST